MKKQTKPTWSQLIASVSNDIVGKKIVPDERWSALLTATHSVRSCKDVLFWLDDALYQKWLEAFYEKMMGLTDSSFLQQRWLAEEALQQNDRETFHSALEKMIEQAKKNSVVAWWDHILRLLPDDDSRVPMCKAQKKQTKELNKNHRP